MYYGNASPAGDGQNPADVWSNDYAAVLHLSEDVDDEDNAGIHVDSSGINDGSQINNAEIAGQIGEGQHLDGLDDKITIDHDSSISFGSGGVEQPFTLSAWIKLDYAAGEGERAIIMSKDDNVSDLEYEFWVGTSNKINIFLEDSDGDLLAIGSNTVLTKQWTHVTATYDGSKNLSGLALYVDGQKETIVIDKSVGTYDGMRDETYQLDIGEGAYSGDNLYDFDGAIDEARISTVQRSDHWISAQYDSMTGILVTIGAEQSVNGVLRNDIDEEGDALTVTQVNSSGPNVGTQITLASGALLTLNADGSFVYDTNGSFETLGAGASTSDSFDYRVNGGGGASADSDGTITITITGVDDAATISGDTSYSGNEGDAVASDLNATDIEGLTDGTYFTVTGAATNGIAAIDPTSGAWTFTPTDPNWSGSDNFTVTVTDDLGGTTTQVVSITLANVDDPATISGDIGYTGNEGDVVAGNMGATDVEGLTDGTYFTVTSAATNGLAVIDPTSGTWNFTPTDPNWFGSDNFTVTVTDDLGGTTTQVVSITLANVNDPATISGDIGYTGNEGDVVAGNMGATDVDGLTDGTYFTVTSAATNGLAAIDPSSGAWTFTPTDPNWFGSDRSEQRRLDLYPDRSQLVRQRQFYRNRDRRPGRYHHASCQHHSHQHRRSGHHLGRHRLCR